MSRFEGPQGIVTNGLVLNLDAGDPDSFTRQFPFYCDALIVAGGGSGGVDNGGGGGGGGVLDKRNLQLSAGTAYTITIGAGGAARPGSSDDGPGNNGSNTTALGYTAIGGGGGTGWTNTTLPPGQTSYVGGSGAGQSNSTGTGNSRGIGIGLQRTSSDGGAGNNGGAAFPPYAGGGGGAGEPGGNAGNGFAGNGGNGYFLNGAYGSGIGVSDRVGGGGAGGWDVANGYSSSPVPTAQNGTIKKTTQTAEDPATSNSGAGGNGSNHDNQTSGAGGSGVVVICYPGLPAATGGDILYENGKTYHRFFSSGTFTPYLWNDTSGNGNNATLTNGPTFNPYQWGGYIDFDGTDDYATAPASSNFAFGTGDFTLECWVYPINFSNTYPHMIALPNQGTFALKAEVNTGNIYFYSPSWNTYGSTSGWTLTLNTWNHVMFTRVSNVGYAYLNGVSKGSVSGFNNSFSSQVLNIHNGWPGEFERMLMGAVRIYNIGLSSSQVLQNFNAQRNRFGV